MIHSDQSFRIKYSEENIQICGQLVNIKAKYLKWSKVSIFKKIMLRNKITKLKTKQNNKADPYLTSYTNVNSKCFKALENRQQSLENLRKTLQCEPQR